MCFLGSSIQSQADAVSIAQLQATVAHLQESVTQLEGAVAQLQGTVALHEAASRGEDLMTF